MSNTRNIVPDQDWENLYYQIVEDNDSDENSHSDESSYSNSNNVPSQGQYQIPGQPQFDPYTGQPLTSANLGQPQTYNPNMGQPQQFYSVNGQSIPFDPNNIGVPQQQFNPNMAQQPPYYSNPMPQQQAPPIYIINQNTNNNTSDNQNKNRSENKNKAKSKSVQKTTKVVQRAPGIVKSKVAAILLAIFLGIFGVHRFYLGWISSGIVMFVLLMTPLAVILPFWVIADIIRIATGSLQPKDGRYSTS